MGALLLESEDPDCDPGVIFFNNVGPLGMCGHGTIGVVRALHEMGRIKDRKSPSKPLRAWSGHWIRWLSLCDHRRATAIAGMSPLSWPVGSGSPAILPEETGSSSPTPVTSP